MKKISIVLLALSIIAVQTSYAARMGKGRSAGMKRSNISQNHNNYNQSKPNYNNSTNNPNATQTPNNARRGVGLGTVAAGAAAGAVGGYMLGKAMNEPKATASSQPVSQPATTINNQTQNATRQIPWGIITILIILLIIGLMIFRRKNPQRATPREFPSINPQNNQAQSFEIPNIRKDTVNNSSPINANSTTPSQVTASTPEKIADGVEVVYFLRQAKGIFLHIQSMNTPENVSEVAKYMTPNLYTEIKDTIINNDIVADFSNLDCSLLNASEENSQYIATVKFYGNVSESPNAPLTQFSELWHFVKPINNPSARWLVAGIEQTTAN